MKLKCEIAHVRCIMDTRSLVKLCAKEYSIKKGWIRKEGDAQRVRRFINNEVRLLSPQSQASTLRPRTCA